MWDRLPEWPPLRRVSAWEAARRAEQNRQRAAIPRSVARWSMVSGAFLAFATPSLANGLFSGEPTYLAVGAGLLALSALTFALARRLWIRTEHQRDPGS